jgi:hypothetical protein
MGLTFQARDCILQSILEILILGENDAIVLAGFLLVSKLKLEFPGHQSVVSNKLRLTSLFKGVYMRNRFAITTFLCKLSALLAETHASEAGEPFTIADREELKKPYFPFIFLYGSNRSTAEPSLFFLSK